MSWQGIQVNKCHVQCMMLWVSCRMLQLVLCVVQGPGKPQRHQRAVAHFVGEEKGGWGWSGAPSSLVQPSGDRYKFHEALSHTCYAWALWQADWFTYPLLGHGSVVSATPTQDDGLLFEPLEEFQ